MGRRHASELAWRATFSCPEGQGYEGRETPALRGGLRRHLSPHRRGKQVLRCAQDDIR
ncbi:MAG TPA: hypothetical protein VET69_08275 [Terriglobales bacterium]|nr:hypothetical protein [Terriglobales bacterium]